MSKIRTFRAASMPEALELVRRELGAEAVILHTREIARRRFLPWQKIRHDVEITAGVGESSRTASTVASASPGTAAPRGTVPATASTKTFATTRTAPRSPAQTTSPDAEAARAPRTPSARVAASTSPKSPIARGTAGPNDSEVDSGFGSLRRSLDRIAFDLSRAADSDDAPAAQTARAPHAGRNATSIPHPAIPRTRLATEDFAARLDAIEQLLASLQRSAASNRFADAVPTELAGVHAALLDAEVDDELARELVLRLRRAIPAEQLENEARTQALLAGLIEAELPCCGPIVLRPGRRQVVALVGPTGVGKTTTIAKLAADFRLRQGAKLGLVTIDTYRIAAVEQLRTYAQIIDLPMQVVTGPGDMRRALDELQGLDLVLVDTAGRSPRDDVQLRDLQRLLTECPIDQVHLVLSLTAGTRHLQETARTFAAAQATALILTKLDEAAGLGPALSLARTVGLPVSYLTTGQDVPDDIEPADPSRLARLILGREPVRNASAQRDALVAAS